jgi:hypothetical protein
MKNPLTRWFGKTTPRRPIVHRPRRKSLVLESLEDRLVMSTYTVNTLIDVNPNANQMTLRKAIAAANSDGNTDPNHPDVINFSVTGTIALASALPTLTGSVAIQGPGASSLTVQGDGLYEAILNVAPGASASVSGLTLDGNVTHNSGINVGHQASLNLQDATIQNTLSLGSGGAIDNAGGSVTVTRGRFMNDISQFDGGAIESVGGSLTVSQSTFDHDLALGNGGAIHNSASSMGQGGALTVQQSTFSNDTALYVDGGAIALDSGSNAEVLESTFFNNSAQVGGAISLFHRANSTANGISLKLAGSTLAGNASQVGGVGGGLYINPNYSLTALVTNTIIAGNVNAHGNPDDVSGGIDLTSSYDLIGDGTGMTGAYDGVNGDLIGTDAHPIDPKLGTLQDNGGPTWTMALLPGSPALDRGAPDSLVDTQIGADQRGMARVVSQSFITPPAGGDGRDIGAYELAAQAPTILTVNSLADANPPDGVLTLRQALEAAAGARALASLPAGQVSVGSDYVYEIRFSVTGTIALSSALPAVNSHGGIVVQGPGASNLTVQGDGLYDAILTVVGGAAASVSGLTLDGNNYHNSGISVGNHGSLIVQEVIVQNALTLGSGAAIDNNGGAVAVTRGRFVNDVSQVDGGAIENMGGSLSVSQSTFDHDLALGNGGAIHNSAGTTGGGGSLSVQESTFSNNTALYVDGGAIALDSGSNAIILDSTFFNNSGQVGGAVSLFHRSASTANTIDLDLESSTLVGNSSQIGGTGGGLYVNPNYVLTARVNNTVIAGNVNYHGNPDDVSGVLDDAGSYDLIGDGAGMSGLNDAVDGNHIGTDAQPINPMVGPLQDNGGPTFTMALLPGSPAFDAGDPNFSGAQIYDQRDAPFLRVSDGRLDIGAFETQVANIGFIVDIPIADAGGPYTIAEGGSLTLDASHSSDPGGLALTYSWDLNGDGVFGDATGVAPTLSWSQLQALGIDDGLHVFQAQVRVTNSDGQSSDSAPVALTLKNTAPTPTLTLLQDAPPTLPSSPSQGYGQHSIHLVGSATDPSVADTAAGFTYSWSVTRNGSAFASGTGSDIRFTPQGNGNYVVTFNAADKDNGIGTTTQTLTVAAAPQVQHMYVTFGSHGTFDFNASTRKDLPWQITAIQIVFDTEVNGSMAGLSLTGHKGALAVATFSGNGTKTLTWTLANPIQADRVKLALTGITDAFEGMALSGGNPYLRSFNVLYGDFDDNGVVDSRDAAAIGKLIGGAYNIFADVNGDGMVDASDVLACKQRQGSHLP